jgi:hypothetical protein
MVPSAEIIASPLVIYGKAEYSASLNARQPSPRPPATVPANWKLIGYFCLGFPEAEDDVSVLQRLRWEVRRPAASFLLRR